LLRRFGPPPFRALQILFGKENWSVKLALKEWEKDSYIPPSLERVSHISELEIIQIEMENQEVTKSSLKKEKNPIKIFTQHYRKKNNNGG
jgi:hypothetical protein